ncbi:MAG: DUF86 domain-containing protein [Deltaproteobacteria bacterium]|nr:DUF86 domain-containing protein [Deltaproteobacteria bacterium]
MVSIERIAQKFLQLDEYLGVLRNISKKPIKDFLNDKIIIGSAKYYLQVSIECCLDVANHIIASERFRAPKDYADSFQVIEEEGLITPELGQKLRQMAKFRNRLVRLYGEIDNTYVYEFIKEDLKDIEELRSYIINKYQIRSD